MKTDQILIRHLSANAIIGIHPWEKEEPQPVWVDLDLTFDCGTAAATDNIEYALDYFEVSQQLTEFIESSQFELIETLAEHCAQLVLERFGCQQVTLELHKPEAVSNTDSVGVRITRFQGV